VFVFVFLNHFAFKLSRKSKSEQALFNFLIAFSKEFCPSIDFQSDHMCVCIMYVFRYVYFCVGIYQPLGTALRYQQLPLWFWPAKAGQKFILKKKIEKRVLAFGFSRQLKRKVLYVCVIMYIHPDEFGVYSCV
jgi:hypothetical protein